MWIVVWKEETRLNESLLSKLFIALSYLDLKLQLLVPSRVELQEIVFVNFKMRFFRTQKLFLCPSKALSDLNPHVLIMYIPIDSFIARHSFESSFFRHPWLHLSKVEIKERLVVI